MDAFHVTDASDQKARLTMLPTSGGTHIVLATLCTLSNFHPSEAWPKSIASCCRFVLFSVSLSVSFVRRQPLHHGPSLSHLKPALRYEHPVLGV